MTRDENKVHSDNETSCEMLQKEAIIHASLDEVWNAWTTNEGLKVVSAESNVELRVGGPFELFLNLPPDASGKRGSEGSKVLAILPKKMLAFSWTFPPDIPQLRNEGKLTTVIVLFESLGPATVQVQLHQLGWEQGADWLKGWDYFDQAWGYVLSTMQNDLGSSPD